MKKLLFVAAAVVLTSLVSFAKDNYSRDIAVLPEAAKTSIQKNFKSNVSVIKIDKKMGRVSEYEVTLTDGSEITFDSKGNWKDIEVARDKTVPKAYIPSKITDYVKANQKDSHIIGIETERSGYEVSLSNNIDLKFDKDGTFLRYD